jgi:hypothetical protein
MDMTESVQGHKYIVCIRDDLSRVTECKALFKNDFMALMRFFSGNRFIVDMML